MQRYGCDPGTTAERPFKYEWGEFDRCPLAVLRDSAPADIVAVNWAVSMAVAKRQGSLAAFVAPNTLSARGMDLIATAEETMAERDEEAFDRMRPPNG